ncbi:TPA: hypothetical protein U2B44_000207 [Streptococcus suis]|nr:hypothetical protein [Streptococcus suis]HEM5983819.1 hypothetical protein [Streptococcus suis]
MREKKEIIITGKHVLHTTMIVYTFFIGFAFIRQGLELPMLIPYGFYLLILILEKMDKSGKTLFEIKIER